MTNDKKVQTLLMLLQLEADNWYQLYLIASDNKNVDIANTCKDKILELIPTLDLLGDCNHKFTGINF